MHKSDSNKLGRFRGEFCSFVLDRLRRGSPTAEVQDKLNNLVPRFFLTYGSGYERRRGIHPSEIDLGGCMLRPYYGLLDTPYKAPPSFEPRLEIGTAIHDIVEHAFEGMDVALNGGGRYTVLIEPAIDNTAYAKKYGIVGNTDFVFFVDGHPLLVGEIKSGQVPSAPFSKHSVQGAVYQMCWKAPYLWYYYTNRDGDKWRCFLSGKPDKRLAAAVRSLLKEVRARVEAQDAPPPSPDFFACTKTCGYNYLCKPEF